MGQGWAGAAGGGRHSVRHESTVLRRWCIVFFFQFGFEYCYTPNMYQALCQLTYFSRLMFVNAHVICMLLDVKEQKADIWMPQNHSSNPAPNGHCSAHFAFPFEFFCKIFAFVRKTLLSLTKMLAFPWETLHNEIEFFLPSHIISISGNTNVLQVNTEALIFFLNHHFLFGAL